MSEQHCWWVQTQEAADGLAKVLAGAKRETALDLEFNSEERYRPDLALLQLSVMDPDGALAEAIAAVGATRVVHEGTVTGDADPSVFLVDPLAVDCRSILDALAELPLLGHAARQDLQLLASLFEWRPKYLWDTQLAAAFCGFGEQAGYARVVTDLVGIPLSKGDQWTQWLTRPLRASQLRYADYDVRYMHAAASALRERLGPWSAFVNEEANELVDIAFAHATMLARDSWQKIPAVGSLSERELCNVRRLAEARQMFAERNNTPLGRLGADKQLLDWARRPPREDRQMMGKLSGAVAKDLVGTYLKAFTEAARDWDMGDIPRLPPRSGAAGGYHSAQLPPHLRLWEELATAIVAVHGASLGIAPRLLATRAMIEDFVHQVALLGEKGPEAITMEALAARAGGPGKIERGWRKELVAAHLVSCFRGERSFSIDVASAGGIAVDAPV